MKLTTEEQRAVAGCDCGCGGALAIHRAVTKIRLERDGERERAEKAEAALQAMYEAQRLEPPPPIYLCPCGARDCNSGD